jgi:serine/threonine-protein kinase HipA
MNSRTDELVITLDAAEIGPARPIGILRRRSGARPVISFEYARSWIERPALRPLDPSLPLVAGETFLGEGTLPGILSDTAPDRWGRNLLERREVASARADGRRARRLEEWDFLVGIADETRMGALRLAAAPDGPYLDAGNPTVPPLTSLRTLEAMARRVETGGAKAVDDDAIALLIAPGSSLGGARPKANFVAPDGTLWIAKFPSRDDRRDVGAWEFVLSNIAREAGIDVAETKQFHLSSSGSTFAAQRFDRDGSARRLFASAMTLVGRRDGDDASYLDITTAIADYVEPNAIGTDLEQLFRRLVFNVLISNRDDHLRNHGFLCGLKGWRLAPAFDVNPSPEAREHSLAIDDTSHEPDMAIVMETAPFYRLTYNRAKAIADEVAECASGWRTYARNARLSSDEIDTVSSAFAPSIAAA